MAKIHMVLQGKGGVGKSMIAATIAQYKAGKGQKPLCIDTDPVNATFEGYKALNVSSPSMMLSRRSVVWLNPYWGPIEHEGKGFEQLKAYTANKGRVSAIIQIPALKEETYGRDFAEMLQDRRTFDEALADSALTIMTRQRLKIVKTQLFAQLENAAVL
jgi:anion-transporting  ArsA/GET3 family ATPase